MAVWSRQRSAAAPPRRRGPRAQQAWSRRGRKPATTGATTSPTSMIFAFWRKCTFTLSANGGTNTYALSAALFLRLAEVYFTLAARASCAPSVASIWYPILSRISLGSLPTAQAPGWVFAGYPARSAPRSVADPDPELSDRRYTGSRLAKIGPRRGSNQRPPLLEPDALTARLSGLAITKQHAYRGNGKDSRRVTRREGGAGRGGKARGGFFPPPGKSRPPQNR